jgi:tRNA modification GTPase
VVANRAYLLTPPGSAAIAVVRARGPGVPAFLAAHFTGKPRLGRASHGDLRDGDRVIDDPVVVLVRPDAADLNLHGGPWVVQSTFGLLARAGFNVTLALPVPLPDDALDAEQDLDEDGRVPSRGPNLVLAGARHTPAAVRPGPPAPSIRAMVDRDVLAHLPLARTELAVRGLLAQPTAWVAFLASTPSQADLTAVRADRTMDRLLFPAKVAIVGAANVGKSTLANRLFGRDRSITADLPGTTRDWVGELADLGGVAVTLVDTPGLRATDDPIEQAAIAGSRTVVASADAVVVVLDAARPLDDEQRAPLATFVDAVVVVNKVDQAGLWDLADTATGVAAASTQVGREVVRVVATTGVGVADLQRAVLRRLGCGDAADTRRPRCWTEQQRAMLEGLRRH